MSARECDPLMVQMVRQFISLSCRGHEKAQTKNYIAGEIALLICKHDSHERASTRAVERAVHEMREHQEQVGSCARGYFWCVTKQDALITAAHIGPRFAPMKVSFENALFWAERLPERVTDAAPAMTGSIF